MAKTPKSKKAKNIEIKDPVITASIDPSSGWIIDPSTIMVPITEPKPILVGKRLLPHNLISEIDSILERIEKLELQIKEIKV